MRKVNSEDFIGISFFHSLTVNKLYSFLFTSKLCLQDLLETNFYLGNLVEFNVNQGNFASLLNISKSRIFQLFFCRMQWNQWYGNKIVYSDIKNRFQFFCQIKVWDIFLDSNFMRNKSKRYNTRHWNAKLHGRFLGAVLLLLQLQKEISA